MPDNTSNSLKSVSVLMFFHWLIQTPANALGNNDSVVGDLDNKLAKSPSVVDYIVVSLSSILDLVFFGHNWDEPASLLSRLKSRLDLSPFVFL